MKLPTIQSNLEDDIELCGSDLEDKTAPITHPESVQVDSGGQDTTTNVPKISRKKAKATLNTITDVCSLIHSLFQPSVCQLAKPLKQLKIINSYHSTLSPSSTPASQSSSPPPLQPPLPPFSQISLTKFHLPFDFATFKLVLI